MIKLSEQDIFHGVMQNEDVSFPVKNRISLIRKDSLYFDSTGFDFKDIIVCDFPGAAIYKMSDSLNWKVIFPPEEVYADRYTYTTYLRDVSRQFKREQKAGYSTQAFGNMLKFNLTKLANLEIAFDYERLITDHWSFEIETGFQWAAGNTMGDDFFMGAIPLYKYSGFNFVAGPKFYFGSIAYVQLVMIYHYLEMDDSRTKFASGGDYGLQYQFRNDLGGAFRFGLSTRLGKNGVLDAYLGGGLKVCMVNQFIYGYYPYDDSQNYFRWYNDDHSAVNNYVTLLQPVFNAGVKIGVGF